MEMPNLPPEKFFYVNDGQVIRTLHELPEALRAMSPETFEFHVNQQKNDFYSWASDVFNHAKLARKIKSAKNKEAMAKKIFMELYM
jgi:hypothetical protein